jgi:hypothetical protein
MQSDHLMQSGICVKEVWVKKYFSSLLGNRYEEDNIFLHNLFPNIEITKKFLNKISLQPILVI